MKLTKHRRKELQHMIETYTFNGIPLSEMGVEYLDEIDQDDVRTLYIISYMLGYDSIDKDSYVHYPYAAEEYLKKFRLK